MATTIKAVSDVLNSPPRVLLTVAGATSATSVTVYRVDSTGTQTAVRSANPVTLISGGWVGYDYEAPHAQEVTYLAVPNTGKSATSNVVGLNPQRPWLYHPSLPSLSVPLTVVSARGNRVRTSSQGVHQPLGRATAIVITDGVRRAPTFDLVVRTSCLADESALDALLSAESTMLLQITYPNIARTQYDWVSVGDVSTTDEVDWFGNETVRWSLPCTVTDSPVGRLQSQRTWADLADAFPDWNTLAATYATWNGVLTNTLGA